MEGLSEKEKQVQRALAQQRISNFSGSPPGYLDLLAMRPYAHIIVVLGSELLKELNFRGDVAEQDGEVLTASCQVPEEFPVRINVDAAPFGPRTVSRIYRPRGGSSSNQKEEKAKQSNTGFR